MCIIFVVFFRNLSPQYLARTIKFISNAIESFNTVILRVRKKHPIAKANCNLNVSLIALFDSKAFALLLNNTRMKAVL